MIRTGDLIACVSNIKNYFYVLTKLKIKIFILIIFSSHFREKISKQSIVSNLDTLFTMMALNVVWQMAACQRFNYHEDGMKHLLNQQQSINQVLWSIAFRKHISIA